MKATLEYSHDAVVLKLLNKIDAYIIKYQININMLLVNTAINYIKKYHKNQKRHSGDPYYYHPINVAYIVIDYFFDTNVIVAALLHDLVEDTYFSLNQINFLFGKEIAFLVDRLTKIDTNPTIKFKLSDEESSYKLLQMDCYDKKVFAIKLSDRLDNMRTIKYIKSIDKQKRIALETMQVFIPIARELGWKDLELELQTLVMVTLDN